MDTARKLLKGCIDMHVHSGPGMIPRSLDHFEAAQQCNEMGMRGLVLKDQNAMTCNVAYFLKKYNYPRSTINIFGGLTLNNATGGINIYAVDTAIAYGAKIIWMPTLSARAHIEWHKKEKSFFTAHKREDLVEKPLSILDDKGKIMPEVGEICAKIANADIILGLGHLSLEEIDLLVEEALEKGVKKILMHHPHFIINASIEDMVKFANKGVIIEQCYAGRIAGHLSKEMMLKAIKKVGPERTILSSDLGQKGRVFPVQGLLDCIKELLDNGVKEEEIDLMLRRNPAKLLNLE